MQMALKDKPATPFRVPPGIKLIRVTAARACAPVGRGAAILEAFKPGTAPPDTYAVIGGERPRRSGSPEAQRAVSAGTGGLY